MCMINPKAQLNGLALICLLTQLNCHFVILLNIDDGDIYYCKQGWDGCWKIASNFNCDLENQLGFLVEEGKINRDYFTCYRRKGYSLVWKEVYSLLKR